MTPTDIWSLPGLLLAEFAGAIVNPLALLAMLMAAYLLRERNVFRRLAGVVIGFLCAIPGAVAVPALAESAAALVGGMAGGLVLAEVVTAFVIPALRLAGWFLATLGELFGFAVRRLGGRGHTQSVGPRNDE